MKRIRWNMVLFIFLLSIGLHSCILPQKEPITLNIWHVYGGQTDSPLNDSIDEFNNTVGKEQGIYIQVTSVSNTNSIHEDVLASSHQEPGSAKLPDMFVSYPKTVVALKDNDILVDYYDYFTKEELEKFIPEFIQEGVIEDKLKVLPIAKSTEILYVNKTAFDRFALETGARLEDLETWESLYRLSCRYREWTDAQTPEILGDGKPFFVHDYHFNYLQVGTSSLEKPFFNGNKIDFKNGLYDVWEPYAKSCIFGGMWLKGGYATEPLQTGDSIVSVASSASVLYYNNMVTYPDNTSEKVELISRPCPVFENGKKMVMQRGAGVCMVKSTSEREKAGITFLKWLTSPQNNVEFVIKAGYMPVTKEAFEIELPLAIKQIQDIKYKSLYEAFLKTNAEYIYYTAPKIKTYLELEMNLEKKIRIELEKAHKEYMNQTNGKYDEVLLDNLSRKYYENFQKIMQ